MPRFKQVRVRAGRKMLINQLIKHVFHIYSRQTGKGTNRNTQSQVNADKWIGLGIIGRQTNKIIRKQRSKQTNNKTRPRKFREVYVVAQDILTLKLFYSFLLLFSFT